MSIQVKPLLTQVRLSYFSYDCGMSYVIRLTDSRFVILDGGCDDHEEKDHLFDLLCRQNERPDGIQIAAWLFSHAHMDHIGCFLGFVKKYGERVKIEKLVYDFRFPASGKSETDRLEFLRLAPAMGENITPTVGMKLEFPGAAFEVMCTGSVLKEIRNFNETSTVFQMRAGAHTVMFLGDIHGDAAGKMLELHSKEKLQSDTVQVAHHGYWGASDELNRAIDPEWVLWPCPEFWVEFAAGLPQNQWLFASPKVKAILFGGRQEVTMDLTDPHPRFDDPYPFSEKGTVYRACFAPEKRVCELGWSCLSGGGSAFKGADALMGDGCLTLAAPEKECVVHILHSGAAKKIEKGQVRLCGKKCAPGGKFGLYTDNCDVHNFEEDRVIWLNAEDEFDFCLKWDASQITLFAGETLLESFRGRTLCSLALVLQDTEIRLNEVCVTKE